MIALVKSVVHGSGSGQFLFYSTCGDLKEDVSNCKIKETEIWFSEYNGKIWQEQKIESLTKSMQKNEQRKSGEWRGKPMLATDIAMVELMKPTGETQNMAIKNFTKWVQIPYIIEEILVTLQSYTAPNEEL